MYMYIYIYFNLHTQCKEEFWFRFMLRALYSVHSILVNTLHLPRVFFFWQVHLQMGTMKETREYFWTGTGFHPVARWTRCSFPMACVPTPKYNDIYSD